MLGNRRGAAASLIRLWVGAQSVGQAWALILPSSAERETAGRGNGRRVSGGRRGGLQLGAGWALGSWRELGRILRGSVAGCEDGLPGKRLPRPVGDAAASLFGWWRKGAKPAKQRCEAVRTSNARACLLSVHRRM